MDNEYDMSTSDKNKDNAVDSSNNANKPQSKLQQLLNLEIAPDQHVLLQALTLACDKNIRISKLSETVLKDPVITLEILTLANSFTQTNEKPSIAAVQTGVIRIGSEQLTETLTRLKYRIDSDIDSDVHVELSSLRRLSARASIVAEIMSSHLQRDIIEVAQTCALLSYLGPMILCTYLQREYLELAHLRKRNALAYRIQSRYNFNYHKMFLEFLKRRNLPGIIFFAFDKELKCKTSAESSLRFIVESAIELVEAIEDGKWTRYTSIGNLPTKSNIRLLKLNENQYTTIIEEIEDSLGLSESKEGDLDEEDNEEESTVDLDSLLPNKNPKEDIISLTSEQEVKEEELESQDSEEDQSDQAKELGIFFRTEEEEVEDDLSSLESKNDSTVIIDREEFMELLGNSGTAVFIEKTNENLEHEKRNLSKNAKELIDIIEVLCEKAESTTTLLDKLMSTLTEKGPFIRAALIEIDARKDNAIVKSAIGDDFSDIIPPVLLSVNDPLSPLSTFCTKVQSFNAKGIKDLISPFGISSYAVSPLKLNTQNPFVFYADCGEHKPLPLEARKIFRIVVAILNHSLPSIAESSMEPLEQNSSAQT